MQEGGATDLRMRVIKWSVKLKVNPRAVRICQMRRKWGSCSTKGIITLAVDLSDREPQFRDFVIAHELLHLRYPHHGRLFKAVMAAHIPNWRELEILR
ncbi:M48 metallopeptidase family protein [Qipengyuania flava]|uniref:M48 metallopeptidase family protein n=1 Tax=Qipengyuania flava TaxID=192812 RepID=UPI0009EEEEC5|nr:DUF45 domain-containing protein [Qipengyuania flava]